MSKEDEKKEVKEVVRVEDGKCVYCLEVTQGDSKLQVYMRRGEIYFESNEYGFSRYPVFNVCDEAHKIAKEIFISALKVDIKRRILELKQLECILDSIGLKDIISEEIKQGGILLQIKNKLLGS